MNTAQLPAAIEIFRPGVLIDDAGVERTFTADDIRAMAEGYDPALREGAFEVGRGLAERGIRVVYGAGGAGLMGAVADGVDPQAVSGMASPTQARVATMDFRCRVILTVLLLCTL